MKPLFRRLAAGLALSVGLFRFAVAAESAVPFRSITFEAATQAAASEGKLVFIDFFTTWCEPCKHLDAVTWTDAAVGQLVGEKAVALKLDAEKEGAALAKRYKINAYPTLLLLKADGTEVDRIVGFREPDKFTADFAAGAAGKSALARAVAAVDAAPAMGKEAVQARYDLARTLAQNGRAEEALVEYLWCYDEGMPAVASFAGVRSSFLIGAIAQLGKKYPPALLALRDRRDQAEATMLANPTDRRSPMDFASLNGALGENDRTVQTFDALPAEDPRRAGLLVRVFDLLVTDRRYADALLARPLKQMQTQFDRDLEMIVQMAAMAKSGGRPNLYPSYVTRTTIKHIEVLIGAGQSEAAQTLARRLVEKVDASDDTMTQLREAARRADHPEVFP